MQKVIKGIKIEKLGYGGIGLARMPDGKRILIKWWALPGSVVDLRIVKQRKDFIEAHIVHIHKHDPGLVDGEVFCPHFFRSNNSELWNLHSTLNPKVWCGWCKWQMLSYPTQLTLKQHICLDAFKKLATNNVTVLPIVGSPLEKGYRNKIEFSFGKYITNITTPEKVIANEVKQSRLLRTSQWHNEGSKEKELNILSDRSLWFHKQGEFSKIVDIANCGLISDQANEVFARVKELCLASGLPVYDQKTHQGFFRHLVIREGFHSGQFLVNLSVSEDNLKPSKSKKWDQLLDVLKKDELLQTKITTFVITYNNGLADTINNKESETKIFWGDWYMYEQLVFKAAETLSDESEKESTIYNLQADNLSVNFRISPFSFFQTNTYGAEQLFSLAMHMTWHIEGTILDLYCGTWSIGISFLKSGKGDRLLGIEIVEEAIVDARHNAKINGLENQVLFVANPAEKALTNNDELRTKIKNIWLVIVDPPRDGLHKNVIAFLADLKKEQDFKLLYISCNPITMVRDIELLIHHGFHIKEVQPVDMFPQTHHIEVIGLLT